MIGLRVALPLLSLTGLVLGGGVRAVEPVAEHTPPREPIPLSVGPRAALVLGPWAPPAEDPDRKDWLILDSGEWLRGTLEYIVDEEVYFESDELDDLVIDWDDVAGMQSPRRNTYRFGDVIVTGTAGMQDGVIRIATDEGVREFPRDALLSMIEGELRELNYWSLDLGLGFTTRSGNSDQTDASGWIKVQRETPLTRLRFSYESAYSVVDDDEITNNQRATADFAYYVSRRVFVLAPTIETFRDRIANIDLRATVGAGLGYDLVDRPKWDWDVVLGAGYQRTEFDEVEIGESDGDDDVAVLFHSTLEWDPLPDLDWDTSYQLQAVVTDPDKTNHHLLSVISVEVWGPLDLDVSFAWDRIEKPTRDKTGEQPDSNDFRLTVGLGLEL